MTASHPATGDAGPAVLLLSGGLDSTTLLALAVRDGYRVHALTFRYGQRHALEVEAAAHAAHRYGAVAHQIASIDLAMFGGSALTNSAAEVPKNTTDNASGSGIPVTYVPARNTIFLSFALAWAETLGARDIFIGVNALDYSGYPDCRPEFITAFERMAALATRAGVEGSAPVRVRAPLIDMRKSEIVRLGLSLGVDYASTTSCYDPDISGRACGRCDACRLRLQGFLANGTADPAAYVTA